MFFETTNDEIPFSGFQEESQDDRQKRGSTSRWGAAADKLVGDCIEGFELDARDEASTSLRGFYPPPEIPKNWQPRLLRTKPSRFEQEKQERAKNLNPSERKAIVSVFIILIVKQNVHKTVHF